MGDDIDLGRSVLDAARGLNGLESGLGGAVGKEMTVQASTPLPGACGDPADPDGATQTEAQRCCMASATTR